MVNEVEEEDGGRRMIQLPWKEEENPVAVTDDVAISLSLTDFAVGTY